MFCPICKEEIHHSEKRLLLPLTLHLKKKHNILLGTSEFVEAMRSVTSQQLLPAKGYCHICGQPTPYLGKGKWFALYCSDECRKIGTIESSQKTCLEKYGVDSPNKSKEVVERRRATNMERYGGPAPACSKEIRDKMTSTCKDRYGVEYALQNEEILERTKQTNLEKYGVEFTSMNKEVAQKISQSLKGKYSDEDWKKEVLRKKIETNRDRFGVDYASQNPQVARMISETHTELQANPETYQTILEKKIETNLKNRGVRFPTQDKSVVGKSFITYRTSRFPIFVRLLAEKKITALFDSDYYINKNNKIFRYKCEICGEEFESEETSVLRLHCSNTHNEYGSNFEISVKEFIESLGIANIQIHDRTHLYIKEGKSQELDIYLPDYNLAIECDGLYWHSNSKVGSEYHLKKTEICENQGIRLIHITDSEWESKPEICKSIIKSALGRCGKIYARKCEVREISNKEYREFCNDNHIAGYIPARYKMGLFYREELVQIVSVGRSRFKSGELELLRHCSKLGLTIVGGFSKLVKSLAKKYDISELITYCDRRWFNGDGYLKSGWEKIAETKPNFWYFSRSEYYLMSRIRFQKHKLAEKLPEFNPELSEFENMLLSGYDRFYDCGSLKFRYLLK